MRNQDLVAFLKPVQNRFSGTDSVDFLDVKGQVTDIDANHYRLSIRLRVPAGLYCGRFETKPNSFDMSTAMIEMVHVPDGKRVAVGPWDLDHIRNVMAVPMIRTYVNGKLKGGLWFAMPGPVQIAEGRLYAEFGFEAREGENEIVLELIERDRERINWTSLTYFELRKDDRQTVPLLPAHAGKPRIFLDSNAAKQVHERWRNRPEFDALMKQLRTVDLVFQTDNSQGTLELACLVYALTRDAAIGTRAKAKILELANASTWSGRPDPLLMGGENDRGIGNRLYHAALGWDYLQPILDENDRRAILSKVEEYLQKIYDFTLLQRAYMGYPTIDPHSLGTWNGAAIACMAFFDELPVARHALPFFHGLFCDSLKLFPASGKAAWATYFPFHIVRYLAAAHTFGRRRPELSFSDFLDNLGQALLAAFEAPNSQEMQRGLRTREHRYITAFLCHFHPTPGIESIYEAFSDKERKAAGDLALGLFDLLYAPDANVLPAGFLSRPLFAKDVGDLIITAQCNQVIAVSISGGPKAGRGAIFTLMPHNREFPPSMGAIDVSIDGTPVLCNVNIGTYGLNSALTNTMCFEDGGALTNGQYLNGMVPPDNCSLIRRCFIGDRYVFAHVVVTHALHPKHQVRRADRIFVFDRQTGVILLSDAFQGERAIRFGTHLHCSGSASDVGDGQYRLSGGQASLIAGIKHSTNRSSDEEKGEIFVRVLQATPATRIIVEEPTWVPAYIYGLNNTGKEDISEGRFPRYQRWRLEALEATARATFHIALSPKPDQVRYDNGAILLPEGGGVRFGYEVLRALGIECESECLLWDESTQRITGIGVRMLRQAGNEFIFASRVDLEYYADKRYGALFANGTPQPEAIRGFELAPWVPVGDEGWRTHNANSAAFRSVQPDGRA